MPRFVNTPDYRHGGAPATGVLLTNLGTPDAPQSGAVRRYLREFLSDPRVVELPRVLWWPILYGAILPTRPRRSAAAYREIWGADGSPLLVIAQNQAVALQAALDEKMNGKPGDKPKMNGQPGDMLNAPVKVALAMRYGKPAIAAGLEQLRRAGCDRLLVLPLYPQYSAATTASTFDAVAAVLRRWRWLPQLRMVMDYHQDPAWLGAVAASIDEHWRRHGRGQKLLFSFHGLPRRFLLQGDPYHCQCHASARLIAEQLGLSADQWQVVFQSRFGRAEWLRPYCDKTLAALANGGIASVDIVCPGFAADCLETLFEIERENRAIFLGAGGKRYHYIAALNDHPRHIAALAGIVENNLSGWALRPAATEQREAARQRALACGAKQ